MATIPIEIILQDAESPVTPTPAPESGGETNITVPDTGTISDVGSNSGGISSSASIILPAIIAVLAMGAMVAMLVHKYHKHQNDKLSKKEKLATAASGTIAILAATVLVGNLVIPAAKAASDDANGNGNSDEGELVVEDKITITVTREADSDEAIVSSIENTSLVTASYDFGYKVTASMVEGTTTANLYLDGNTDSPYYIAPVSDGILTDNTWGYTLSEPTEESSYLSIPLSTKPTNIVKEVAKTVEDTAVNMYYTVQIDKDIPNGTYTGELEYTISPAIEYMQDFSTLTSTEKTATLARMPEGKQYILKDNRDESPYYISKLKDNNVWMTQNLDLDIDEDTTYTHADTDLGWSDPNSLDATAKWKPDEGHSTITFTAGEGATVEGWVDSDTAPYSADPGDVYYYTSGTDANDTKYDSLADCERDHNDGSCPHYHAGNYYNWSAAVASNNTEEMDTPYKNAPDSICPAGWRLPYYNENSEYALLYILFSAYGILGTASYGQYNYADGGFNAVRSAPLYNVRSGSVLGNGDLDKLGDSGFLWFGTTGYTQGNYKYATITGFGKYYIYPQQSDTRDSGIPIRCMAK